MVHSSFFNLRFKLFVFSFNLVVAEYTEQTILQELEVQVRTRTECRMRWGRRRILNSHICVGNGENGACNVSI